MCLCIDSGMKFTGKALELIWIYINNRSVKSKLK